MAFAEPIKIEREEPRYDIYDPRDKEKILAFEKELELFGNSFDRYAIANRLWIVNGKYKLGAVAFGRAGDYKEARKLFAGMAWLQFAREEAKRKNDEQTNSLIAFAEKELKGKMVV